MKPNSIDLLERFRTYLEGELQKEGIKAEIEKFREHSTSTAGKSREGIFTKQILWPPIRKFFAEDVRQEYDLSDAQIKSGLGAEGFEHCEGFSFTPASRRCHLFTKSLVIESSPPEAWFAASEKTLATFYACPDFAIRTPLPLSLVGEVKYFISDSPQAAVRELYNAARQAAFYLGAFHDLYQAALIVVADASPNHSFFEGMKLVKSDLLQRFGTETDIHLFAIRLR